jgi:hypothetical protein
MSLAKWEGFFGYSDNLPEAAGATLPIIRAE